MNPEQLRTQLEQRQLESARRKTEAEAAEAKRKADEEERESREKAEEDRILRDITEAEERVCLQRLADEKAQAEAAVKDAVERAAEVAAAEEKWWELADAAGHATAEAEEAKEKQRVLDDGEYKKLIREKKNTNGPLLAKYTIRSESTHFTIFVDTGRGEGGSGSGKKVKREGGVGRIAGSSRRGAELMEEDWAMRVAQGYRQIYGEGRCSTCVNCQCMCWINVEAIEAWKEDVAGMATKRIPKIASCWMCTAGKRKCRLPATKEFWEGETHEPRRKELKGKARLRDESTVPSVVLLATSSMKRKRVEVEMPGRPRKRLATEALVGTTEAALHGELLKLLRSIDTRLKGIEAVHLKLAQAARNNNALMTNGVLNMVIANKTLLRIEAVLKDKPVGLYTEERDRVKKDLGIVEEAEDEDGDDDEDMPRKVPIVDLEAEEASGVESSEAETEESGKEMGEETGGGAEESEGAEDEAERSGEVAGDMVE